MALMRLRKVLIINEIKKGIALHEENLLFYGEDFYERAREFPEIAKEQPADPKDDGYCYANARMLALKSDGALHYVDGLGGISEGVQIVGDESVAIYSCVPHAWCVNRDGQVIDPSWDAKDQRFYFGIPIPLELVEAHQQDRESDNPKTESPALSLDYLQKGAEFHAHSIRKFEEWLDGPG